MKIKKRQAKNVYLIILDFSVLKNPLRKHQIFEKSDDFENRPSSKRYSLCKNSQFGSKIKIKKKHAKNDSLIILEFFCAKYRLKKHQIFEK